MLGSAHCGSCGRSLLDPADLHDQVIAAEAAEIVAQDSGGSDSGGSDAGGSPGFTAPPPPPLGWTLADGAGRQALLPPPPTRSGRSTTVTSIGRSSPSYGLTPPTNRKGCGVGVMIAIVVLLVIGGIVAGIVGAVATSRGDRLDGPALSLGVPVRFDIGENDTGVHALSLGEGAVTISVTSLDSGFDPVLRVLQADGDLVGENDDAVGLDPRLSFTLSEAADFTVEVHEFSGDPGDYEIEVTSGSTEPTLDAIDVTAGERVPAGDLHLDETVDRHLGEDDVAVHRLRGFEGVVSITVVGVDGFDPVLQVVDQDGTLIGRNDDSDGRNSFLSFTLSTNDQYDVEVTEFSGDAGFYGIRLERGDGTQPAVRLGDALQLGVPVQGEVVDDQVVRHDFAGDGQVVTVDVVGLFGFDPVVRVLGPGGDVLAEDDDSGDGQNSHVELQLPGASTVIVEVGGFDGRAGQYEVTVA